MIKTINQSGRPVYKEVKQEDGFDSSLFHEVDMSWSDSGDAQYALHTDIGSITVLDRLTGFGFRDVETGYRDTDGRFWLASGDINVMKSGCKTIGEAIQFVKDNANNCVGE